MKQKLYALDAFFIEELKLSENDPIISVKVQDTWRLLIYNCPLIVSPIFLLLCNPGEGPGVKSRMCPPYPQRDRKRRLNGAVCRNHRIKRVVPCRC